MSATGAFTFVLHSHQFSARQAGHWHQSEQQIHKLACETCIPLLQTLYDLKDDEVEFRLTLSLTPLLSEQLADPTILKNLDAYLEERIAAARQDMIFFEKGGTLENVEPVNRGHLHYLAEWYLNWYRSVQQAFQKRFNRDLIGAFRQLQDDGYIEIITSAATHAYLPLLSRDESIKAQLKAGIASYERLFKCTPSAIWLPGCGYRPASIDEDSTIHPGLEKYLADADISVFFSETHAITGGQPVGVSAGDIIGPHGIIKRHYVLPVQQPGLDRRDATTYQPYYVSDQDGDATDTDHSGVAVIGRNNSTGQQVWSSDWGYPGDFDYREFDKKAGTSGLKYWRVTGARVDLAHKDLYHPDWAAYKIDQHAEHFAHLVGDLLRDYHNQTGKFGLIASNYETGLFGHWWFEGIQWLNKVLRHLASDPGIELTTASQYLKDHPPKETLSITESSWGVGGGHFTWDNGETHWMLQPLHESEERMVTVARQFDEPTPAEEKVLNQAARELMLAQSSDWSFLITTGRAKEFARRQFSQHIDRFNHLLDSLEAGQPDTEFAENVQVTDSLPRTVDFRWFQ